MLATPRRGSRLAAALATVALATGGFAVTTAGPVGADAIGQQGSASAFGAEVTVAGTEVVKEPVAAVTAPSGDVENIVVDLPAAPVAVNGTLIARANVQEQSTVDSGLTVVDHTVAGPYNARGLGQIENLELLIDAAGQGVPLLSAAAVRAEAVAVCTGGNVSYSANSELIDLVVGGNPLPLNAPVTDLVDAITGVLDTTGLDAVVEVERNVVTELAGGGVSVDALLVEVLSALGEPLATVRLAHGEVGPTSCGLPECSDTLDNDGDGTIDADDPACHTDGDATNPLSYDPLDDSETKECSDTIDNADPEDTLADIADPGCHTDGDAANPDSYDPFDHDETDDAVAGVTQLPRTGGTPTGAIAGAGLLAAALGALGLRRRIIA